MLGQLRGLGAGGRFAITLLPASAATALRTRVGHHMLSPLVSSGAICGLLTLSACGGGNASPTVESGAGATDSLEQPAPAPPHLSGASTAAPPPVPFGEAPPPGRPGERPAQPLPPDLLPPAPMIFFEQGGSGLGGPWPSGSAEESTGASPGSTVEFDVQTLPRAQCSIAYRAPRGGAFQTPGADMARPSGLGPKTADEVGWVSWAWTVPPRSPSGYAVLTVECMGHGTSMLQIDIG